MALPDSCVVSERIKVARRKRGAPPNRLELTYYGVSVGAAADSDVAGTTLSNFQQAVNHLAEVIGRPERLDAGPWIGLDDFAVAYTVVGATGSKYRGGAMSELLKIDMTTVSEEQFRYLVSITPNLTAEMNAAADSVMKDKAETSDRIMPLLVGGAILGLAIRGLVR